MRFITRNKSFRSVCLLLLFGAVMSSCLRNPFGKNDVVKEDRIVFSAMEETGFSPMKSKSTQTSREFLMEAPSGDSLILYMTEAPVQTKGASLSNATLSKFYVTAYLAEGLAEFMMNEDITLSEEEVWEYSPVKYWPQNGEVHFFAYADSKDTGLKPTFSVGENAYTGQFSYTLPEYDSDNAAQVQPDLMFAARTGLSKQSVDGSVLFRFYHALSAINFKIGDVPDNVNLVKITFVNVSNSGSCAMDFKSDGTVGFTWQNSDTEGIYTQNFGKSIKPEDVVNTIAEETTFMMIPQTFDDDVLIEIYLKINERDYVIRKNMKDIHKSWDPNKKYIYVISTPEEVDVEISDEVNDDGNVKSDLSIVNSGFATTYIRAMIIGQWVTENINGTATESVIVGQWNRDTDGEFTYNGTAGLNPDWLYCAADGFYYYKLPVLPGMEAPDMFTTYTLTASPPVVGAELDLHIAVQAVMENILSDAWGGSVQKKDGTDEIILK